MKPWHSEADAVDSHDGNRGGLDWNESNQRPRKFDLNTEAHGTQTDGLPLNGEESDLSSEQAKLLTKFRALPREMRQRVLEAVRQKGLDAIPAGLIAAAVEKCAAESHSDDADEEERPDADLLVVEIDAAPARKSAKKPAKPVSAGGFVGPKSDKGLA